MVELRNTVPEVENAVDGRLSWLHTTLVTHLQVYSAWAMEDRLRVASVDAGKSGGDRCLSLACLPKCAGKTNGRGKCMDAEHIPHAGPTGLACTVCVRVWGVGWGKAEGWKDGDCDFAQYLPPRGGDTAGTAAVREVTDLFWAWSVWKSS